LECLEKSSKQITLSKPLSLTLSAIDIPINGNVYDNKEEDEEWEDNIKQYQLINHIKDINLDNLLKFWFIPT